MTRGLTSAGHVHFASRLEPAPRIWDCLVRSHTIPPPTEPAIYERWLDAGCFTADAARVERVGGDREPYTIVMPPPNVTAILHVGHGLNNTDSGRASSAGRA